MKYSWVGQQHNDSNRQNQAKREMFLFANNEKIIIGGGYREHNRSVNSFDLFFI